MRAVRSRDTTPELIVRRVVTSLGHRYRLHKAALPGKPDLVISSRRKAIFVHGCFWHGHDCKRGSRKPKSNVEYWQAKIQRNRQRDADVIDALNAAGWNVLIVWECETRDLDDLSARLNRFLA